MADNSRMIKLGLVAAVAYYGYSKGWFAGLGIGTPQPAAAPIAPAAAAPNPNAITGSDTVAGIQARTILAAKAPAEGLAVDDWGYSLNEALAPLGKSAPDPMPIFTAAVPGFNRDQKLTAGQY